MSLYGAVAAAASLVVTPLLALAYFATDEGAAELEVGTVSAWAEPARDALEPLLTFASTDTVYYVYLKLLALLFPAVLLGALAVRARRPAPAKRGERWGWRIALTGYALLAAGLILAPPHATLLEAVFLALVLPGLVLGTIGSSVLGIALLRAGFRPRATAILLALSLPLWLVASGVLGHNGMGLVPPLLAWAAATWPLGRPAASAALPSGATRAELERVD